MQIASLGLAVLFLATATTGTWAQSARDSHTRSDDARTVTIRGCVEGLALTATDISAPQARGLVPTVGTRFRVVGDRELLDELRALGGHEVDLIGVLRDETGAPRVGGPGGSVTTRTRIWASTGRSASRPRPFSVSGEAGEVPELEMLAVIPVKATCPI
jgi:hypothetical protein